MQNNTSRNILIVVAAIVLVFICCICSVCASFLLILQNQEVQEGIREGYCEGLAEDGYTEDPLGWYDCN